MATTWRQHFRPIIREVIEENQGQPEREIRRALREAKPSAARSFSSVNAVWLSEVKKQLAVLFPRLATPGKEPPPGNEGKGQIAFDFG